VSLAVEPVPGAMREEVGLPPAGRAAGEDHAYLVAGTPFEKYRDFLVKELPEIYAGQLSRMADQWRAASVYHLQLRATEPTWADDPPVQPLPPELQALADRVRANLVFQKGFTLPVDFAMVELDRLVVHQQLINLKQVERLKDQLGAKPTDEQVFRLCLPLDHPAVEHSVQTLPSNTFIFRSPSNDIRFLESAALGPEQVPGYLTHGTVVGVAGVLVGFGCNYLNALAFERRLALHNGSHRAYALRDLGITHVPCVIQQLATKRQLLEVAVGSLRRRPDLYFKDVRPPVLKDYFDARLRQILRLTPSERQVVVKFTVETRDVPRTC
jgi:hypothetical protein